MKHRRVWLSAAGTGVLVAGSLIVATNVASAASTGCKATYTVVNQWPGGFQGTLAVTNLGDPLTYWSVGFTFPDASQKVAQGWNGRWSQSGATVTVANESWNGNLATNGTVSPGFIGSFSSFSSANPVPTSFTLNGVTCTGNTTTTTATRPPTTPPTTTTTRPPTTPPTSGSTQPTGVAPALHVSGNKLLTANSQTYRLLGVDRSSMEYICVQGKALWDGGPVDQASVDAMKAWNIHALRIPLNEECWLGVYGSPSGATYQQAVKDYVTLLVANGINPILDMHWSYGQYTGGGSGCSDVHATCQKPMPDAQYAPQFWTSVANTFKGNNAVVLDLFNEPYPDAAAGYVIAPEWTCWRDGGTCQGISYQVAGMQNLIDAVRATGATNVIMAGGIAWSNDLSHWLEYKPTDPTGNLMASWHSYNFNACSNTSCWDSQVAPVAAQVPVDAGEIGANDCGHSYIDQVMAWADSHGIGYQAWTWNPWGCTSGGVLIQDYAGTPVVTLGEGLKAHLLTQNPYS